MPFDFSKALYDFDFTKGVLPAGGAIERDGVSLDIREGTFTLVGNNQPAFYEDLGLIHLPSKMNSYAYDLTQTNVGLNRISVVDTATSKNHISASHIRADGITSGVARIWRQGASGGTLNFGDKLSVKFNKVPFDTIFTSFALKPVIKSGVALAGCYTNSEAANTSTCIKIDLTHPSLVLNEWTIIYKGHPAIIQWQTPLDISSATEVGWSFSVDSDGTEYHVDLLSVAGTDFSETTAYLSGSQLGAPFLFPPDTTRPAGDYHTDSFYHPLANIPKNEFVIYVEGWTTIDTLLYQSSPRFFSLRNNVLQEVGSTTQNVESIGFHPSATGEGQLNSGLDANIVEAKQDCSPPSLAFDSSVYSEQGYDIGGGLLKDDFFKYKYVIKKSKKGWRLFFNGRRLKLSIKTTTSLPYKIDMDVEALDFVNPANINEIRIGAGRTREWHWNDLSFYITSRVSIFNSVDYTDAQLQAFSSVVSTAEAGDSLVSGEKSGFIKTPFGSYLKTVVS